MHTMFDPGTSERPELVEVKENSWGIWVEIGLYHGGFYGLANHRECAEYRSFEGTLLLSFETKAEAERAIPLIPRHPGFHYSAKRF